MASGPVVGEGRLEGGDDGSRPKQRWVESKVYTRKAFKGQKNSSNKNTSSSNNYDGSNVNTTTIENENSSSNKTRNDFTREDNINNKSSNLGQQISHTLASEDANLPLQQLAAQADAASQDSSSLNRAQVQGPSSANDMLEQNSLRLENRVRFNLSSRSKKEMQELRNNLENELHMVRMLVKKIEAKEVQITVGSSQNVVNDVVENGVANRVHSEVASVGHNDRGLNHLSIPAMESNQAVFDNAEKEKRTPKANPLYKNSEFLLGKDRLPNVESHKKLKVQGKKHGDVEFGFGIRLSKYFKSCTTLLERLMKHKHGWIFNTPVDVEALGLHDYYSIIKHPMDLGTIKSRLSTNWYKSPTEFAQDVRRTFTNAMIYNPKGQDVHTIAEKLSKIFEERWAIIEADYMRELRSPMDFDTGLPTPSSRKTLPVPPLEVRPMVDRSDFVTNHFDPKAKPVGFLPRKAAAPKKPKANDPHKRDMTFEEKQRLSANLQNLPSEKLDQIVQIIKKRNSSLSQHDDEIEVDIDSVDAETLWELDRFVTNYKKILSKNKRKAGLATQARAESMRITQERVASPNAREGRDENATGTQGTYHDLSNPPPNQEGISRNDESGSSSSTSSSSDSGSSSSDSDSESSSEDGSDTAQSPRT